jgi:hypothetical protein
MQVRSVRIVCACWIQGVCFILSSITVVSSHRKPESADISHGGRLPFWEQRKNRRPLDCSLSSRPDGQPARLFTITRVFNAMDYADFKFLVPSTLRFPVIFSWLFRGNFFLRLVLCSLASNHLLLSVAAFIALNSVVLLRCKYCLPF